MKTKITLLALLFTILGFAQNGINYKAVIRDNLGNVVANQSIKIRFTILKGTTNVYQETHTTMTDDNGIAIVDIGMGNPISESFANIYWGVGAHFLNVELDPAGGNNFVPMGQTEFKSVPYALNIGLEAIDEDNGIGWRLKGRNSANYGDIGLNAVDLSNNIYISDTRGATGADSFATGYLTTASQSSSTSMGLETIASGLASFAIGDNSEATARASTAMGRVTKATGDNSTSMGYSTTASGVSSFAMGKTTYASGLASTAMGLYSNANGDYSVSMGNTTRAGSYTSVAIGQHNIGTIGNLNNWVVTEPLFEIGIGLNQTARKNALTVLKNGNVGIGNHTPKSILEVSHPNITPNGSNFKNAFSIVNNSNSESWQLHVNSLGALVLYRKGIYKGFFEQSSGEYFQTSDRRLKKDIIPLENNTLNKVMQLNPVSYQMKDQEDEKRQIGLISQEVQNLFPSITEMVPGQDVLALSYTELIPVLIKAIQQQQELISSLKSTAGSQQTTIENQDSRMKDLTADFDLRLKQIETIIKISNQ